MFSTDIIDSDLFLEMPSSSKCLYYDLGMRADDDGFVSPNKVVRLTGASSDDLKVLIAKKFIIPFESGVIVIKDWKMNNYIKNDRYTETIHKEEKKLLIEDENRSYSLENPKVIQTGSKVDPQVRLELGKVRKDKVSIEERDTTPSLSEEDLQDISNKYELPMSFVKSKYDDLLLWVGERPNNSKLKGRNWKLTLMKWCKTDGMKIRKEELYGRPEKRGIDASQI